MFKVITDISSLISSVFVTVFYLLTLFFVHIVVFHSFSAFCGFNWAFYIILFFCPFLVYTLCFFPPFFLVINSNSQQSSTWNSEVSLNSPHLNSHIQPAGLSWISLQTQVHSFFLLYAPDGTIKPWPAHKTFFWSWCCVLGNWELKHTFLFQVWSLSPTQGLHKSGQSSTTHDRWKLKTIQCAVEKKKLVGPYNEILIGNERVPKHSETRMDFKTLF